MKMFSSFNFTSYVVDINIWKSLEEDIKSFENILVITGVQSYNSVKENILPILVNKKVTFENYLGECSVENYTTILEKNKEKTFDIVVGIGGGKAIDTSKIIAAKLNLDTLTVPTIASTCASTSSISIVYKNDGSFEKFHHLDAPPKKTYIDLKTIKESPFKYTWAGIGDTIAKFYEVRLKSEDKKIKNEKINFSSQMAIELSQNCRNIILRDGENALYSKEISEEFSNVILTIIVNTGMVSNLVDDFLNGAIAHSVFYGLTTLPRIEKEHLHGEVVAYGVLVQLYLEKRLDEYKLLKEFYEKCKFPIKLSDIVILEEFQELKDEILNNILAGPDFINFTFKPTKEELLDAFNFNI